MRRGHARRASPTPPVCRAARRDRTAPGIPRGDSGPCGSGSMGTSRCDSGVAECRAAFTSTAQETNAANNAAESLSARLRAWGTCQANSAPTVGSPISTSSRSRPPAAASRSPWTHSPSSSTSVHCRHGAGPGAGTAGDRPPFGKYYGIPGETVDVEAGFPVSGPVSRRRRRRRRHAARRPRRRSRARRPVRHLARPPTARSSAGSTSAACERSRSCGSRT